MAHWMFKAASQKILSILPGGRAIHRFFQQHLIRSLRVDDFFLEDRLSHVQRHLTAWSTFYPDRLPENCIEIGTGWYPVVPLGLYLSGVDHILTVDPYQHLTEKQLQELIQALANWHRNGKLRTLLPNIDPERLEGLLNAKPDASLGFLQSLGIHYLKEDPRNISMEASSIEMLLSNNTFEHIPADQFVALFQELKRISKPGAVWSHYIDMADHYSYSDARLSPYHFLRFSEKQWRWIENSLQSQNRLRLPAYRAFYEQLGIPIDLEKNESGTMDQLAAVKTHSEFDHMTREDLGVLYSQIISHLP